MKKKDDFNKHKRVPVSPAKKQKVKQDYDAMCAQVDAMGSEEEIMALIGSLKHPEFSEN